MVKQVYILNTYEEDGPEDLLATCELNQLRPMLEEITKDWKNKGAYELGALNVIINHNWSEDSCTQKQGSWNLSEGWGGLQLHIVNLYESKKE